LRARTHFRRCRGRRVPFSRFALPDSFSAVPSVSGPIFMFCAPRLIFGGIEGVGCRFLILRAQTHFRRYRGRRVPFPCFWLLDIFMRSRTRFRRYGGRRVSFLAVRGRRVPLKCFALLDSFSAVLGASGPIFLFCAHGLVFGGTEGVESLFHIFGSRTYFRRNRGHQVRFHFMRSRTRFRR
jgi:hypothetical protein